VDLFSRRVIYNKVFFLQLHKSCVCAYKVVKALKRYGVERGIHDKVLIKTDNVTEFVNKEYHNYIKKHPYFIGSTLFVGHCKHNTVIESFFNKAKITLVRH
jgi:hypothetical protein